MLGPGAAYRFLNDLVATLGNFLWIFGDSSQFLANGSYSCLCKEQGILIFQTMCYLWLCHVSPSRNTRTHCNMVKKFTLDNKIMQSSKRKKLNMFNFENKNVFCLRNKGVSEHSLNSLAWANSMIGKSNWSRTTGGGGLQRRKQTSFMQNRQKSLNILVLKRFSQWFDMAG